MGPQLVGGSGARSSGEAGDGSGAATGLFWGPEASPWPGAALLPALPWARNGAVTEAGGWQGEGGQEQSHTEAGDGAKAQGREPGTGRGWVALPPCLCAGWPGPWIFLHAPLGGDTPHFGDLCPSSFLEPPSASLLLLRAAILMLHLASSLAINNIHLSGLDLLLSIKVHMFHILMVRALLLLIE